MNDKHGASRDAHVSRRRFLSLSAQAGVLMLAGTLFGCKHPESKILLPGLPYSEDALEPVISAKTVQVHYGKHHKGYIDKLNKLLADTPLAGQSLMEIIRASVGRPESRKIFNNAAQAWNHQFYWRSLKPNGGGKPSGVVKNKIDNAFGSVKDFKSEMINAAVAHFGSGWLWLVATNDQLKIVTTGNADVPLAEGMKPLLAIDLWEHAYYLDYQHRRTDYVEAVIDKLINWTFAQENLGIT